MVDKIRSDADIYDNRKCVSGGVFHRIMKDIRGAFEADEEKIFISTLVQSCSFIGDNVSDDGLFAGQCRWFFKDHFTGFGYECALH